ncbi:MAG: PadR family transcriptional regulator [Planctomycetes bacterium]|nr:PadR family transcriptional regulator [Planctomycetota bacterium]
MDKSELLQGTLDMLILKALALEAMHGFGVSVRIRQMSRDVLQVEQGSLYPALYRLEQRGWITSEWGVSENNRKAKFYISGKACRVRRRIAPRAAVSVESHRSRTNAEKHAGSCGCRTWDATCNTDGARSLAAQASHWWPC